jgi:hypothetical protein
MKRALAPSMLMIAAFWSIARAVPSAGQAGPVQAACELRLDPIVLSAAERAAVLKGGIVLRPVDNPGLKGRTFEAVGTLPGSMDECRAVILDYRHYDEFMPRTARTVVTDEGPAVALVEQYLKLPLGMTRCYRLRYTLREAIDGFRVDWEKVPWPELPPSRTVAETSGHWQVGRTGEGGVLAVYHVYTEPGHVPLGLKGLALSLSKHDLPKVIERVRARLRSPAPIKD